MLGAGFGAALGARIRPFGSYTPAILCVARVWVGVYLGRAIDGLIRKHEIASQQAVSEVGRVAFGFMGFLCLIATLGNVRWFVHGGGAEALSAAAMMASATAGFLAFACVPTVSIRSAMLSLGVFNAGLAALSLYALVEAPSTVSLVSAVWCVVVAGVLLITHSTTLKTVFRPWHRDA